MTPFVSFHCMHACSRRLCSQQPGHSQWLIGPDTFFLSLAYAPAFTHSWASTWPLFNLGHQPTQQCTDGETQQSL